MKATIYDNTRCGTSRTVLGLLEEAGCDIEVVDYQKTVPTAEALTALFGKAGLSPRQGLRAREPLALDLDLDHVSDAALLEAMVENPVLIERPLVETEKGVRLCRPPAKLREIL